MAEIWVTRVFHRYEPRIGWLSFSLLLAALAIVIAAALEVEWVPEDRAIIPAALFGFVFALWLSRKRISAWIAWLLLIGLGPALAIVLLARLRPPFDILIRGNPAVAIYWEKTIALFSDRLGGWIRSVAHGGLSLETIGFALGLVMAAWFLGAFLGWTSGRLGKAVWGLAALGIALALTTYFGRAGIYWVIIFVGVSTVAVAIAQYTDLEMGWTSAGTDYSGEVRVELLMYAGAVSLLLMSFAYALPVINVRAIAESFRRQAAVSEAEDTLSRVFAGVAQPRPTEEVASRGNTGVLPRAFLLSSSPELLDTPVYTATVNTESGKPIAIPGYHWRTTSYDVYTGQGWQRSLEREELFAAGEQLPLSPDEMDTRALILTVLQDVRMAEPSRTARYTIGRPISFDSPSVTYWRGRDDLVRARDAKQLVTSYQGVSRVVLADATELRLARLEDVPAPIMARYTELPDSVPERVRSLAREVAGLDALNEATAPPPDGEPLLADGLAATPYDQALALESFLHQYPYSRDIGLPPSGVDMVDYFLYDLQTGFCDYYATAMVVMARSLGLPARLAIGFLPQPADDNGQQILRQGNAHSWAEIYFAGYGWVEFEPTAPIPGQEAAMAAVGPSSSDLSGVPATPGSVAIPERDPGQEPPLLLVLSIAAAALIVAGYWVRRWCRRRQQPFGLDSVQSAYYDLQQQAQRMGRPPRASETPTEFVTGLIAQVDALNTDARTDASVGRQLFRLADLFDQRQYSRANTSMGPEARAEAATLWRSLQPQLNALTSPWRAVRRLFGR